MINGKSKVAVTAGLRGASWQADRMSVPFSARPYPLVTEDGQAVMGFLFSRGGESRVAFIMHPRELVVTHYLVPDVLDAGWACWVQGARSVGNDLRLEHEFALHDVAAGMRKLTDLGFIDVVLIGNSGGAGLFAFYNQQSLLPSEKRVTVTPGGRPTKFQSAGFPVASGVILVSPHPGQGVLLMNALDPSVTDEKDALSLNENLNPFSAANGYRPVPESSVYSAGFVEKYREAQKRRVERIDRIAKEMIEERQAARKRFKQTGQESDRIKASFAPIFQVWRTDADLRCWDTSLDPSDRYVGSLWGADPYVSNYGSVGFGRVVTPESWLSTWSGISSNATFAKCADSLAQPLLLVEYSGDNCVFPADVDDIYAGVSSTEKMRVKVRGNHHGQSLEGGEESGQILAGRHITEWLQKTFSN